MTADEVAASARQRFPEAKVLVQRERRLSMEIEAGRLVEAASFLKEAGFEVVSSLSVVDDLEGQAFTVAFHLWSHQRKVLASLKVVVPRGRPRLPSLTPLFESANWHEREASEMFGLEFEGHPKLGRLLLPEDWEGGYPLRKDFALDRFVE